MANMSYDQRKKEYEWLDDTQKQQFNSMVDKAWDNDPAKKYMDQYKQEQAKPLNVETSTPIQNNETKPQYEQNEEWFYTWNSEWEKAQNRQKLRDMGIADVVSEEEYAKDKGVSTDLDITKFNEAKWDISVKEWTAAQTWKPDYQISSDARLDEMKSNLDRYFKDSPRMFQDRETFNKVFEYDKRESEAQKQLLDSYWKRKQDIDNANLYTTGDSVSEWMKNAEITPDQLNYIKEYNNDAYREWQQKQIDDINLRIANLATPADPTNNAELFNQLVEKLNLEPWDPYKIYDNWYNMCERLWVFSDSQKLANYQNKLDANHSKMESIMTKYANSTWWTVSDALAAARMAKALAPYQQMEVDLQNSYTALLNWRNSNLAIANQSATALAMQAQEDQRVWNQRYQALWFAMTTANYRSPEQQAQLQLQTAQIQNDMSLLQQSLQNDLGLYNTYQTTKLQNQLQNELTDLSVADEQQLRANLNNLLSQYYSKYWDIIQRSQAQTVDDVIAYAKKKWISVAQALSENFIKPLQNKAEYKQKVASDYGMLSKQTITTINWKSVIMTTNPNWSISYQYIEDPDSVTSTAKPYDLVDEKVFDTSPQSHSYYTLADFMADKKTDGTQWGWQCAKFVNDYLENIGVWRYFWNEDIKTRASRCNSDSAKVWTIAVFDYNNTSSDGINHWHVGIVVDVDDKWFRVLESNFDKNNPEKISKRYVLNWSSSCKGFFDPSKPASAISSIPDAKSVWGLSSSQLNSLAEDYINWTRSYSDIKATYWENVLNAVWKRASQLTEYGYEKSKIITDPAKIMSAEQSLMSKFNSMNDWNKEALTQINKMQQALDAIDADKKNDKKTLNSASQTIVTAFNKILDPSSVVRESEYARTPEWQSYIDKLQWKYDQITKWWAWLTYENLKASVDLAQKFAKAYQDNQNQLAQLIRNQAKTFWLNESNILPIDVIQQLDNSKSTATWPSDPIQAIWEDDYENTYGISYSDTYYLVNG